MLSIFGGDGIYLYRPLGLKKSSAAENALKATPCLCVMHGKVHSWECYVYILHVPLLAIITDNCVFIGFFGVEGGKKMQHLVLVKIWNNFFHIFHMLITQL